MNKKLKITYYIFSSNVPSNAYFNLKLPSDSSEGKPANPYSVFSFGILTP